MEIDTCDNELLTPDYKLPIELRLVKYLRVWRDDATALVGEDQTVTQKICGTLEWYICECIPYGPADIGSWWSDGIIDLHIARTGVDEFKLLGLTWVDSLGTAPFEIDLHLGLPNDPYFAKTIFRLGMRDDQGKPKICDRNLAAGRVLNNRPQYNRDWAMAVELTPPARQEREP